MALISSAKIHTVVGKLFDRGRLADIHTHLFDPAMDHPIAKAPRPKSPARKADAPGRLFLWGIDDLLTYHYIIAEFFRVQPAMDYQAFFALPQARQAELVWQELFLKRSPLSESCRGVLTILQALGLDPNARSLTESRRYFAAQTARSYTDKVFKLARIKHVYMTNDPLNPFERAVWEKGFERDPRFLGALRLDSALMHWPQGAADLQALGYAVDSSLSGKTLAEVRRYLQDWCRRLDAQYMAISLPPTFRYPNLASSLTTLIIKTVLPVARELNIPVALMIGVKKLVNPALGLAGDSVGQAEIETLEQLAGDFPQNRFLITYLSRENSHELCVAARKFRNITPFGCWWFLNVPSLIREVTAMRLELLGISFIPQHSDARVLDQLIYKWEHARTIIAEVLADKYTDLIRAGRRLTEGDIRRDLQMLFNDWPQGCQKP